MNEIPQEPNDNASPSPQADNGAGPGIELPGSLNAAADEGVPTVVIQSEDIPPAETAPVITTGTLWRDALLDLAAGVGIGLALVSLVTLVLVIARGQAALLELQASAWAIAGVFFLGEAPMLYFGFRRLRRNREKQRPAMPLFEGPAGPAIRSGVTAGLAMVVLSMFYSLALQRFLGDGAVEDQLEFLDQLLSDRLGVAALTLVIAFLVPIFEEVFFRAAIFGSAHAAGFTKVGAIISALLFAVIHLRPLLIPFYAIFALVMCWLYLRSKTLVAPIAAHMTLNGVAVLAALLAPSQTV